MSRFSYSAILTSGKRVQGTVRARDRSDAARKLKQMGHHPIAVAEAAETGRGPAGLSWQELRLGLFHRIRVSDLAVMTRQMASLLKAGLPMVQTLTTLRSQCAHRQLNVVLEEIEATITRDAASLADALDEHPRVFDPVYRGLVRSGEEGGNLVEVLSELARNLGQSAKLRGQVVGAFIYPVFLTLVGAGAIFVLMAFVVPKFQVLFSSFGRDLPWVTRWLIAVSSFLSQWWWAVLAGVGAAIVAGTSAMRRRPFRQQVDRLTLGMPIFGPMFLKLELTRIARTLGTLSSGGVRILEALRITGDTTRNLAIQQTFGPIVAAVSAGSPLADAFQQARVFPAMMVNLIRTAEHTGELPEMLAELASIYEDEAERAVNGSVKLLEPMLIVAMGLVIAGIVAAVLLPIFQANVLVT